MLKTIFKSVIAIFTGAFGWFLILSGAIALGGILVVLCGMILYELFLTKTFED